MAAAPDSVIFHHLWLLWLAAGVAVCLPPVFESPFLGFLLSVLIILLWICTNVSPKRILGWFFMSVIEIFFREIGVRNQFKVPPQNVPCLFVCAPHSNLFLDALVVMHAVGLLDLCFLTAAKSMRKRILGTLMRINEAIPVERSADLAFSVAIFSICAVICLGVLVLRRACIGYELGGPVGLANATAAFFVFLWFVYIAACTLYTYGYFS